MEKSLKAVIAHAGGEFPFTHNLDLLLRLCKDVGHEVPAELCDADRLTPFAAIVRYGLADPGSVEVADALRWAALAVAWAEAQLASEP